MSSGLNPIIAMLERVPMLSGLSAHRLELIAASGRRSIMMANQQIVRCGESYNTATLIMAGKVECTAVASLGDTSEIIPVGSMLNELAMIVDVDCDATCVARNTVKLLTLSQSSMHKLMAEDDGLMDHFVRQLTTRLDEMAAAMRSVQPSFSGFGEDAA